MVAFTDSDIARYRRLAEQHMPGTATIARTAVTVKSRVADGRRDEHVEGMPHFVRLRRWHIFMPDGTDVTGGDSITAHNKAGALLGHYYVMDTSEPTDYSVQLQAFCVMTRDAAGRLAFPTNQTVTFRNPRGTGSGANPFTAQVFLSETSLDVERFPESAGYKWAVIFDPALGVRGGWEMTWTDILGETHSQILNPPTRLTDFLPVVMSYVRTQ